jgi:hypothetical protein
MKRFLSFLAFALMLFGVSAQTPFTQGNLAVLRVGDGSAVLSNASTAIFIDEFTPSGTFVQSIAIPTAGDNVLTNSGTATSEGQITLSPDGLYLTLAGYNIAPGTASVNGTTAVAVNRKLLRVDNGVNYTAVLSATAYNTNNIRGGITSGDDYWASGTSGTAGTNGVQYFGNGTPVQVSSTVTNIRVVNIYNNQLYFSTGSGTIGIWKVGTGTPTTTGQTSTNIIATGTGSSPYAFAFNTASNICYIADDRTSASGGVQKWTESGGTWTLAYTLSVGSGAGARGLTVDWSGANPVIYATTTGNKVVTITDTGIGSAFTDLASAAANTALRGIAFAPASTAGSPQLTVNPNQLSGFSYLEGSGPSASQSFTIDGSDLSPEAGSISVLGTTNYEVSLNNSSFQGMVSFGYTGGEFTAQTVYVRLKAGLGAGTYNNENIGVSGGGATQKTVACSGTVSSASVITVGSVNPFGNQEVNTVSAQQNYLVSGANLGDELEIYAPAGFEISKIGGNDFTPSNPILLSPVGGTVAPTTIYVRFAPTQAIAYSGNITHDSPGAFTQNVAVSGTGIYGEPTNYPTDFMVDATTYNTMQLTWTDALGGTLPQNYLIKGSSVSFTDISDPVDGTAETNSLLVRNVAQGVQSYTFTGLDMNTTYYFKIFPYTNQGPDINYKTAPAAPQVSGQTPVGPIMIELVFPQYMGSKSAASSNNCRTPLAYCVRFDNLDANTIYDLNVGLALTTDGPTDNGAGNTWNAATSSFSGQTVLSAFTTDENGNSGPVWVYMQPTGNSARFGAGHIHNLRVRYRVTGASSFLATNQFNSVSTTIALDIPTTPLTASDTDDDGAFIKGVTSFAFSDKYVLLYDNMAGTGAPLYSYQVRTAVATNTSQSQLPVSINDVYMQAGTSVVGDFAAVVPIGANNPNGVKRIEFRNADNTLFDFRTTTDGIWGSEANTTTIARRDVQVIDFFEPTNHATDFAAGTTTATMIPLTWTDAAGLILPDAYLIKGSTVGYEDITDPEDGTPEADGALVQNVNYGIGAYTFTGLDPATQYFFKAFPYTGTGTSINYKTGAGTPQATGTTLNLAADKELNVLFFLEGPYNGTFMNIDLVTNNLLPNNQPYDGAPWNYAGTESVVTFPANVVDWVLVELRDASAPELAIPSTKLAGWPKAMFVRTDGQLIDLDGSLPIIGNPAVANNLYIVIRHRNHIDIMSATGLVLSGNTYSYDFTGSVNQAYGGSLGYKLLDGGACGMASGDMDADGKVFASDFVEWATDSGLGDIYSLGDLDFDGNVFASDFVQWAGNSGLDYPVETVQPDVPVFVAQVPDNE